MPLAHRVASSMPHMVVWRVKGSLWAVKQTLPGGTAEGCLQHDRPTTGFGSNSPYVSVKQAGPLQRYRAHAVGTRPKPVLVRMPVRSGNVLLRIYCRPLPVKMALSFRR